MIVGVPTAALLFAYVGTGSIVFIALAYIAGSFTITLSNIVTTRVRLQEVPKAQFGLVNTLYFSIVSLGQVLGSAVIVPHFSSNHDWSALISGFAYAVAGLYGLWAFRMIPERPM